MKTFSLFMALSLMNIEIAGAQSPCVDFSGRYVNVAEGLFQEITQQGCQQISIQEYETADFKVHVGGGDTMVIDGQEHLGDSIGDYSIRYTANWASSYAIEYSLLEGNSTYSATTNIVFTKLPSGGIYVVGATREPEGATPFEYTLKKVQ